MKQLIYKIQFVCFLLPQFVLAQNDSTGLKQIFAQPSVLLEMFSSEGCSSCALASKFLGEVITIADSTHSPVYVLDYHVDIWNKSGWIDPYSDTAYSKRQDLYMQKVGQVALFTPMLFVNGKYGMPAGDRPSVGKAIYNALGTRPKASLLINGSLTSQSNTLNISFNIQGLNDSMILVLVLAKRKIISTPTAGENAGITIVHHNVVRDLQSFKLSNDVDTVPFSLYNGEEKNLSEYIIVGFLQNEQTWEVYATDEIGFKAVSK
jgi:hypothetical protein